MKNNLIPFHRPNGTAHPHHLPITPTRSSRGVPLPHKAAHCHHHPSEHRSNARPQNANGDVDIFPDLPAELLRREGPGPALVVDYRPPYPWVGSAVAINLNNAVCFLFFVYAGLAGRGELVRPVWIYIFSVAVLHDSVSAAYYAATGRARDAVASALVVGPRTRTRPQRPIVAAEFGDAARGMRLVSSYCFPGS